MRLLITCFVIVLVISACSTNPPSVIGYDAIPSGGNAANGEVLFTSGKDQVPPCIACHLPNSPASPDLAGFGERAASRIAGQSAHEYAFYSITEPARFIVEGYGNAMYNQYDEAFTAQDIADLIAYILSL
jgi:mono/diheme cytochrome c family protein